MDGSGYPRQLKGDQILLEARILSVADVVESMSTFRPYRPTIGVKEALMELRRQRAIQFDPKGCKMLSRWRLSIPKLWMSVFYY